MAQDSGQPIRPLGLTSAQFVEAARARGGSAFAARDEYKALFRDGIVPASWMTTADETDAKSNARTSSNCLFTDYPEIRFAPR
jgi:hypothetical protein